MTTLGEMGQFIAHETHLLPGYFHFFGSPDYKLAHAALTAAGILLLPEEPQQIL
jgi:hypothetical protein